MTEPSKMEEPKFKDVLNQVRSGSKAVYQMKILLALSNAIKNEHYETAARLRDLFKLDFKEIPPNMERFDDFVRWYRSEKSGH